jgi:hypothetical protein
MSDPTTKDQNTSAETASLRHRATPRRAYLLYLLLPAALIGFVLYLLMRPVSPTFQVKGKISAKDVNAIRREIRHLHLKALSHSICHFQFASFWNEIRTHHKYPLQEINSADGESAYAIFCGVSSTGNKVTISYAFTNACGIWSCHNSTIMTDRIRKK